MNELRQPKDMAYFRVDIRLYSPERYTFEEKQGILRRLCPIETPICAASEEETEAGFLPPPIA